MKYVITLLSLCLSVTVFGQTALPVLKVSFSGSFDKNMSEYIYGRMELTDETGTVIDLPAKFKTRGATAKSYMGKPSFNMKLRDAADNEIDSTLLGLRSASSWILDAMAIDRICMRNRVAFDLWNEYSPLPYETNFGSRNGTVGKFVEVYINGLYKGIYCLTDRINRKLLDLKKVQINEDSTFTIRGVMYKHGTNDIKDQNTAGVFNDDSTAHVIGWHDAWELSEPEDYGSMAAWATLYDLYDNKHDYDYVLEHYWLDNLAEYQIFITALSIGDNWGNKNSYISIRNIQADGNKKRVVYTPWDMDTSLGGRYDGGYYDGTYSNWTVKDVFKSSNKPLPFSVCGGQTEYKQLLKEKWIKGRNGALSVESVKGKLYAYRDLFLLSGAWQRQYDSMKDKSCLVEDLSKEIDYIVEWYKARYAEMDAYFEIDPASVKDVEENCPHSSTYYNMMGVSVEHPTDGIYINNGRKVLLRSR